MSIKFPISAIALATVLTLAHSAIASAESYKSGSDQVVITGLTAQQKYDVQAVSLKGKKVKKSAMANTCGEILINGTSKVKSLTIGTESIDVTTLATKSHTRCNPKKKTTSAKPTKTKTATPDAMGLPATTVPTTTMPSTVPTTVPTTK
jgi:hypothetical protein